MFKTEKKSVLNKLTAVLLSLWLFILPMSVSANYLDVDKYGIYDANGKLVTVGDSLIQQKYYYRWSLSSVSPDYTYDCWIQITSEESIEYTPFVISNSYKSYYSNSVPSLSGVYNNSSWTVSETLLGSLERISDKSYKVHVYWNSNVTNFYSATLQLQQTVYCTGFNNIKIISQGVGVYYDPGGSNYEDILNQINNNVEALPDNIKDKLQEHDEEVKQEASTSGDDNVNKAADAISKALPIASVKDAVAPLVTSLSYTGTTSVWTLPRMYIPAVGNLFDEIELTTSTSFDLGGMIAEYEQQLPPALMLLVRSTLTAGLILYCIKELIDLFREVFDK